MHNAMIAIAKIMAFLGALVLSFLIVMTCVSVLGRELNSALNADWLQAALPEVSNWLLGLGIGPITGDFELIENAMAFAIFAFLPLCQIQSAHATVDVFTERFSPNVLRWMRAITEVVFAIVLIAFAVQLYFGMLGKMRYNETTYLIQFPVWWAYAAALGASVVAAAVGTYLGFYRLYLAIARIDPIEEAEGAA